MRVHTYEQKTSDGTARVQATVTWEDCDRPEREIFIETDAAYSSDLSCNPNAFMLAAIIPAMRHGERRILVDRYQLEDLIPAVAERHIDFGRAPQ